MKNRLYILLLALLQEVPDAEIIEIVGALLAQIVKQEEIKVFYFCFPQNSS